MQETRKLLDAVLSIQPRIASVGAAAGGKSLDEQVLELACSIEVGASEGWHKMIAFVGGCQNSA